MKLVDLHSHTLWSDGTLIPSEHVRRAIVKNYEALAITDHADATNIEILCREVVPFARRMNEKQGDIVVLAGIELTHVLPEEIKDLTEYARAQGIHVVVMHGETIVEPVRPGTNRAAILAGVDILAHPGIIAEEDVALAAERGVALEISYRKGNCLGNGRVVTLAKKYKAPLVINSDAHDVGDFLTPELWEAVGRGAGLTDEDIVCVRAYTRELVSRAIKGAS
ncbi:histidinol phosphate phosphatase domain-containing protein [Thermospira aquatica]|uniref:Histidinol phosphate phosphatase domain-containing protein n=1 Tax=Thermospira aquatica TaxID=2828656 RepID=A0AAX3BC28_9SPIR|nr:histidinol phosphate phosphatase domain-containing protein [Thermospira aquatica]URA09872.1 histidinol phosphate phosphatase domain-containing protein [Thermospira aquatica]